jgi:hypothetical protein
MEIKGRSLQKEKMIKLDDLLKLENKKEIHSEADRVTSAFLGRD